MFKFSKPSIRNGELVLIVATAVVALLAFITFSAYSAEDRQKNANQGRVKGTQEMAVATFGSGCFWCTEADFDKVPGVLETISGYMGGKPETADYQTVSSGTTKHQEVLQVTYDPSQVTYKTLLDHFWRTTDIVDGGGQFCDRGPQYKPVVFAHNNEQLELARSEKAALNNSKQFDKPVAVEIKSVADLKFTAAEDYHQNYYKKKPLRYKYYRYSCGRDARLKRLWRKALTN
ncbi:MAG: peptide-methionine (S)-S-oxide reductase MsrA [Hyphomicrobiaceae bacterium]